MTALTGTAPASLRELLAIEDARGWIRYINETMDLFSDAEVGFASHHWPTWGKDDIRALLANQHDTWALELSNSVRLNSTWGRVPKTPDLKLTLTRQARLAMLPQDGKLIAVVQAGIIKVEGSPQAFGAVVAIMVEFPPQFNIVTP